MPPNDTQTPKIDLSPCDPGCLNDFSSAGNVPIYLDRFGTRLATPERRFQPSVTGPDGGNSSFFISDSSYDDDDGNGINSPFSTFISGLDLPGNEYPNFFGTSASAPHVAAVAALMRQTQSGAHAGAGPHDPRADRAAALEAVHVEPSADRRSDYARPGRLQRRRGHRARGRRCGRGSRFGALMVAGTSPRLRERCPSFADPPFDLCAPEPFG